MIHKHILLGAVILFCKTTPLEAQETTPYQIPPKEIADLVDAPLAPAIALAGDGETLLFYSRDRFQSIEQLSQKEMRLGGLRINPVTHIGSRTVFYNKIELGSVKNTTRYAVEGLPDKPQFSHFQFSPNDAYVSFTHTTDKGVELWVIDIKSHKAKRLTKDIVNASMGQSITWARDSKSLLVKVIPADKPDLIEADKEVPTGPTVAESGGEKAQNRTYQDLLKSPTDEKNFEILTHSEIKKVYLDGTIEDFLPSAMYDNMQYSPDGEYILIGTLKRPFSYLVPFYRFPFTEEIYTQDGKKVKTVHESPLIEVLPQGFMATQEGIRNLSWRSDKPATLYWVEALDKGNPEVEVPFRDALYELPAPFTAEKQLLTKVRNRYAGVVWGDDTHALIYDSWFSNRNTKTYLFNPSDNTQEPSVLFDRNYQDAYSDPGSFVTEENEFRLRTLKLQGSKAFLIGDGYTPEGQFPFLSEIDLTSGNTNRLYTSSYTEKFEDLLRVLDLEKGEVLVRIESKNEFPNYYIRNIKEKEDLRQVTDFKNPYESLTKVHKELVQYTRDDGVELTGTLYLPAGYDKKEKLPMILWAYPREYKDKSTAGQNTTNENTFVVPNYGSPIFWVTQGYAVLDNAAFPIVGEGEQEPNDSFREQLVGNARAAIDALDERGVIDRNRVGVGGHSYGAFMTANLLSHSDLFAAGIARSGAYNRTLTPFGFQSEERNYWEAPELYYDMSPFMHAEKVKTPILLIHGAEDNNSGTYPMQSERYFNALKGLGATARLVILPKESHGYAAKESIMHMLWEQHEWLEKYVKNRKTD